MQPGKVSESKFVLRIQLADMRQGEEIVSLRWFPSFLSHAGVVEGLKVRVWCNGEWENCDPDWARRPGNARPRPQFNSMLVEYDLARSPFVGSEIEVVHVSSLLTVSPTSDLWASVPRLPFRNPEAESLRSYFESVAQALRYRSIKAYPSLLDVHLRVQTKKLSAAECIKSSLRAISESFPVELSGVPLMGAMDCSEEPSVGDLLTERFMTQSDYLRIGRCFPSFHPVLMGDYQELSRMKGVVGVGAELFAIASRSTDFELGLLYLSPEILQAPDAAQRLKPWLALESESIHAGEYEVRGSKILSLKRSRELESAGVLSDLPDGFVRYLLVSAHHCKMIGVNPEDMMTYVGPAAQIMKTQAEVDSELARTDVAIPPKERVWLAYEATAFRNVAVELKDLIRQLYFGGHTKN
jgi:hypothetical protein